jgi:hypothetical protein
MSTLQIPSGQLPDVAKQYFSLGHMAQMFQRSPYGLQEILTAAGHKPAMTLDDIAYYDGSALLAVAHALRDTPQTEFPVIHGEARQ